MGFIPTQQGASVDINLGFANWGFGYDYRIHPPALVGSMYDVDDPNYYDPAEQEITNTDPSDPASEIYDIYFPTGISGGSGSGAGGGGGGAMDGDGEVVGLAITQQYVRVLGGWNGTFTLSQLGHGVKTKITTGADFITNASGQQLLYKDANWPVIYRIEYNFSVILQSDITPILQILRNIQGEEITFIDHDGDRWVGQITSVHEPVVLVGKDRNTQVKLIFEGKPE